MPEVLPTKAYPIVPNWKVTVSLSERKTRTIMKEEYSATWVRNPTAPTPAKSFTKFETEPTPCA